MTSDLLAILGGPPVLPQGPPPWPLADDDVHSALARACADGTWGCYRGPHGDRLAKALGDLVQAELVTLCCSGTFAVELALRALGIGPGDEVILAAYDYPGNFRSIERVGARPVLVDVDRDNWNLDPGCIAAASSERARAIIVSHLHGGLVPMEELCQHAREQKLSIVEDACQAVGATVQGRPAGAWGDVGVFSFGGSKLLSAGRGGALVTRRADVHQRAKNYCQQGNNAFPLSELQAAVLLPQVEKLPERHARRLAAVHCFSQALGQAAAVRPLVNRAPDSQPAYYKLGLRYVDHEAGGRPRSQFIAAVQAEGVALDAGFRGFTLRSDRRCRAAGPLEQSQRAARECLVLHHPVLLEPPDVVQQAAHAIRKVSAAFAASG